MYIGHFAAGLAIRSRTKKTPVAPIATRFGNVMI
jgi:hypothetical protein